MSTAAAIAEIRTRLVAIEKRLGLDGSPPPDELESIRRGLNGVGDVAASNALAIADNADRIIALESRIAELGG